MARISTERFDRPERLTAEGLNRSPSGLAISGLTLSDKPFGLATLNPQ